MRWLVRTPTGLLSYFDGEDRAWVLEELSEAEAYLALRRDRPDLDEEGARAAVRRAVEDHRPFTNGVRGDGLSRWREAQALIREADRRRSS